jgi:hypothetical protein
MTAASMVYCPELSEEDIISAIGASRLRDLPYHLFDAQHEPPEEYSMAEFAMIMQIGGILSICLNAQKLGSGESEFTIRQLIHTPIMEIALSYVRLRASPSSGSLAYPMIV